MKPQWDIGPVDAICRGVQSPTIFDPNPNIWFWKFFQKQLFDLAQGWIGVEMLEPTNSRPSTPQTFPAQHVYSSWDIEADCKIEVHLGIHIVVCKDGHLHAQLISLLMPDALTPLTYLITTHLTFAQSINKASTTKRTLISALRRGLSQFFGQITPSSGEAATP